jgi:Mlc titration factor MtfA (ptsG expression regulator)
LYRAALGGPNIRSDIVIENWVRDLQAEQEAIDDELELIAYTLELIWDTGANTLAEALAILAARDEDEARAVCADNTDAGAASSVRA